LNRAARGARRVEEGPWRGAYRVGSRWKIPAHIIQRRMAREEPTEDFDRLAVLEREVAALKATLGRLAQALNPAEGDTERPPR
jgi:hypothetical protein